MEWNLPKKIAIVVGCASLYIPFKHHYVIPALSGHPGSLDSCSLLGVRDRFRRSDMADMVEIV